MILTSVCKLSKSGNLLEEVIMKLFHRELKQKYTLEQSLKGIFCKVKNNKSLQFQ